MSKPIDCRAKRHGQLSSIAELQGTQIVRKMKLSRS